MSPKKRWWVKKFGKGWWVGYGNLALGDFFSTWERAYAEAVRQTHIVEVELPEAETVAKISGEAPPALVKVISWKTVTFIQEGYNEVGIFTVDLKPLALHLLALHYHHERNQK